MTYNKKKEIEISLFDYKGNHIYSGACKEQTRLAFKIEIDDHKMLGFRKRKNWISKSVSSISDKIEKETHTTLYIRKSIRIPDWMVRKLVSPGVFGQDKSRRY